MANLTSTLQGSLLLSEKKISIKRVEERRPCPRLLQYSRREITMVWIRLVEVVGCVRSGHI